MAGAGRAGGGDLGGAGPPQGPLPPDLQDMSPMVLSCEGPEELFLRHKLVLEASWPDSRRMRVFCARGEWRGPSPPRPP